jgi:tetratricopeptide (TPR) repeat protein
MNTRSTLYRLAAVSCALFAAAHASAAEPSFASDLLAIQHEFDAATFEISGKAERKAAWEALLEDAAAFSRKYPEQAEAAAWEGIVLSAYAGEIGAMSAMKYAKAARAALTRAERMDPESLDGGLYASLGALYSKVPGGFIGFGDDDLAAEYFVNALKVDPSNIDSNFFYGEFLIDQGDYAKAVTVLEYALEAPAVATRPLFDAGRRAEIRKLLATAKDETN